MDLPVTADSQPSTSHLSLHLFCHMHTLLSLEEEAGCTAQVVEASARGVCAEGQHLLGGCKVYVWLGLQTQCSNVDCNIVYKKEMKP